MLSFAKKNCYSFLTNMHGQRVQTQIRPHQEEQSDLGLHCLPFHMYLLDTISYSVTFFFEFYGDSSKGFWCPKIEELYHTYLLITVVVGDLGISLLTGDLCTFLGRNISGSGMD